MRQSQPAGTEVGAGQIPKLLVTASHNAANKITGTTEVNFSKRAHHHSDGSFGTAILDSFFSFSIGRWGMRQQIRYIPVRPVKRKDIMIATWIISCISDSLSRFYSSMRRTPHGMRIQLQPRLSTLSNLGLAPRVCTDLKSAGPTPTPSSQQPQVSKVIPAFSSLTHFSRCLSAAAANKGATQTLSTS